MYHPIRSPGMKHSTSFDNHANAINPSTWFVSQYTFKRPDNSSLLFKLELLIKLGVVSPFVFSKLLIFSILADHFLECSKTTPSSTDLKP